MLQITKENSQFWIYGVKEHFGNDVGELVDFAYYLGRESIRRELNHIGVLECGIRINFPNDEFLIGETNEKDAIKALYNVIDIIREFNGS